MQNENTPAEGLNSAQTESESALRGAACSAVLVRRLLGNAPRVFYWKVYVAGEALHEDHDKEEWAEEQSARLREKLSQQNDQVELPPNGGSESKKDAPGG